MRAAAGEALSLVYSRGGSSARGLLQSLAEGEEEEEGEEEDAAGDEEMEDGAAAAPDPALLSRMRQLAVAHPSSDALRRSKRDRAAQRSAFRGILASVERGGAVAATKVKLQHGGALVVDTVEGSARLAAFRRVLAGGFQVRAARVHAVLPGWARSHACVGWSACPSPCQDQQPGKSTARSSSTQTEELFMVVIRALRPCAGAPPEQPAAARRVWVHAGRGPQAAPLGAGEEGHQVRACVSLVGAAFE